MAPTIVNANTDPEANQKLYDDWADTYTKDVLDWGYNMPEVVANTLKRAAQAVLEAEAAGTASAGGSGAASSGSAGAAPTADLLADFPILDAGAGDGLSGRALKDAGFGSLTGIDLSPELIEIARTKNVYGRCEVADLCTQHRVIWTSNA